MSFQAERWRELGGHLSTQGLRSSLRWGWQGFRELVTVLLPFTSLCNEIFSSFFLSMSFSKFIFSFFSMKISVFSSALMARILLLQSSLTVTSLAFRGSRARIFSFWWAKQGKVGESLWGHGEQLGDVDPKVTGSGYIPCKLQESTHALFKAWPQLQAFLHLLLNQGQSLDENLGLA